MPIKLPKGFARRKSSGNVLDEAENAPEPSFKVFERPGGGTRAFEGGVALKGAGASRYYRPSTAESDNIFAGIEKPLPNNRGSAGTHQSNSTGGPYDSSSSARYSSSSTLPSSTDVPVHNDPARGFHDIPVPESPSLFSLRAAGRTFSFGTRPSRFSTPTHTPQHAQQPLPPQPQQQPVSAAHIRDRAMTASSASTATPPKLLETDLNLDAGDNDNFSSMFENFGKRKSAILLQSSNSEEIQSKDLPAPPQNERLPQLAPLAVDHSQQVEASPYSWDTQTAHNEVVSANDYNDSRIPRRALAPSQSVTSTNSISPVSPTSDTSVPSTPFIGDADAEIVRQSLLFSSKNKQPEVSAHRSQNVDEETPLFGADEITSHARLASQYEERANSTPTAQNKIMTPAQFERYRQQRELTRKLSDASKSDSSIENDYDEVEDEAEKSREATRQRRKQEAHLSVYRQQMMKVIGEQAPVLSTNLQSPSRLSNDRANSSTPNLSSRMSTLGLQPGKFDSGKSSDGDDDDDVPLAILAAHGFPNRNRPPTRLNASSSNPNLRGSVVGPPVHLPVFARNLPRDPYYGAGLVNAPVRESLALGGGAPSHGIPQSSTLPPGGLIGVIATEERARAMRRGSPNTQVGGISRPYSAANMGQMGAPAPWGAPGIPQQPHTTSPGEQAQLQISQQMTEIMQVQVQMMQQMMQMQGLPGGHPIQANTGLIPPPGQPVNTGGRPLSTASSFHLPGGPPQADQRTLSLLDPNMSRWNLNGPPSLHPDAYGRPATPQGAHMYAPSIAPSERSNVGMASRYRPVSTVAQDAHMARSSTFTSTLKPWNNENQRPVSTSPASALASDRKSTSIATVTVRSVSAQGQHDFASKPHAGAGSDDDEDKGWADMMKKREKKKSSWKLKKETPALGDLLHMVH
ncbi:hypothetical protein BGW36DRAFT_396091 [Talaromyces proteolyticus]|uniref:Uncharacterized protein n=1 Tax=Talaromyces proteolyticus TaxID=1131652 RepID=A0AAD4KW68_9EURO|nr:uncharacterized protein BGW36DRAFT_396091 [Talaromyces proteolyticus]KAH8698268.1 hypothetical protein BGW36DRAFT_396091 [Talaromyces proteolyticus]